MGDGTAHNASADGGGSVEGGVSVEGGEGGVGVEGVEGMLRGAFDKQMVCSALHSMIHV